MKTKLITTACGGALTTTNKGNQTMKFRTIACIVLVGLIANVSQGQMSLPRPEPVFSCAIGSTFKDSEPAAFPQAIKAPKGAPNVLLVLLDDGGIRCGGAGAVREVPTPSIDSIAAQG